VTEIHESIKAAFAKELAHYPPMPATRFDVGRAARRTAPRLAIDGRWFAATAAALIAVLIVGGLISTRSIGRRSIPTAPIPSPKVTATSYPAADYGPPPPGVNLIWVQDPRQPLGSLQAFDWTGLPRATIQQASPYYDVDMAPDGQLFRTLTGVEVVCGFFMDRLGNRISTAPGCFESAGVWADDNRHLCLVVSDGSGPETLTIATPGQQVRDVEIAVSSATKVAACSPEHNRAVLERESDGSVTDEWIVRISDGRVTAHKAFPRALTNLIVSSDATLVAESEAGSSTVVRSLADGQTVAMLSPSVTVLAFSGDNTAVLTASSTTGPTLLALVKLDGGTEIWKYSDPYRLKNFTAEPGGTGFAFLFPVTGKLVVIRGDGSSVIISGPYVTSNSWSAGGS